MSARLPFFLFTLTPFYLEICLIGPVTNCSAAADRLAAAAAAAVAAAAVAAAAFGETTEKFLVPKFTIMRVDFGFWFSFGYTVRTVGETSLYFDE